MPVFDQLAAGYAYWIERVNPPNYSRLLASLPSHPLERALDAGCGPGYMAFILAARAHHVVGVDISPAMLTLARRKQRELPAHNVLFLEADLHALPLAPASFDVVTSEAALHDTDVAITLPALRATLRPGGHLLLRDLVTRNPDRARSPTWQRLRTLKSIPRYLRRLPLSETVRLLRFELSPAWVHHKCDGANLTPAQFRAAYAPHLPDCRYLDFGWAMAAIWQKPA